MNGSLHRMDDWIDTVVVVLVVAALGIAATVPRFDRDTWETIAALNTSMPACAASASEAETACPRTTTIDH